jgi:hypothetical protein
MKNLNSNTIIGVILVMIGLLLFASTADLIDFNISLKWLSKFWPLCIVAAGLAVFLNDKKTVFNPLSALFLAAAVFLGIFQGTVKTVESISDTVESELDIDLDDESSEVDSADFKSSPKYSLKNSNDIKEVNLNFKGGASEVFIEESNELLVNVETNNFKGDLITEEQINNGKADVKIKMDNLKNFEIKNGKLDRKIVLKLNDKPSYNLDFEVGAGKFHFDVSSFKVKNFKIETGASDLNLKMGELLAESNLNIESGVSNIDINVPKATGCRIKLDSGLSAKDLDGFIKKGDDIWESQDYDKSKNKININIESGLSAVNVKRY